MKGGSNSGDLFAMPRDKELRAASAKQRLPGRFRLVA